MDQQGTDRHRQTQTDPYRQTDGHTGQTGQKQAETRQDSERFARQHRNEPPSEIPLVGPSQAKITPNTQGEERQTDTDGRTDGQRKDKNKTRQTRNKRHVTDKR